MRGHTRAAEFAGCMTKFTVMWFHASVYLMMERLIYREIAINLWRTWPDIILIVSSTTRKLNICIYIPISLVYLFLLVCYYIFIFISFLSK